VFGLGFLNGAFLAALVAGAIPILIHLLNRRRVRRVRFSSLEFLDASSQRRMRRVNIRRILILALRTLAVLLLALAFARPTLRGAFFLPGKAPRNVVICLDASGSMAADFREGTAFDRAREAARRIVNQAGNDDRINLVVFGRRAEEQIEGGTRNKQVMRTAIDNARDTAEVTSIGKAIAQALEFVAASDIPGGEIYVVSDFRNSIDSTQVSPKTLPRDVRLFYVAIGNEQIDNAGIDMVTVPRKLMRPGEVVRVKAMLTNHSRTAATGVAVALSVEGTRKAEKIVDIAPEATTTVTFPVSFTKWGTYRCAVTKNRDRLRVDDERYFTIEISRSVPVTLIRGARNAKSGEATAPGGYFYVEKALNPRDSGVGEFRVSIVDERDVTAASLPRRGVAVWVDPQKLAARRLAVLKRYVRRGGGLMVFLGGANHAMLQRRSVRAFLGIGGSAEIVDGAQSGYTSFREDHPVFRIFNREELQLLSRSRVRRYVRVSGVAPDSVLAYVADGDPAVWECARGRGRVLVFAAAPDLVRGDIPLSPMFLPLVHTSVSWLASAANEQANMEHLAGVPLVFDPPQAIASTDRLVIRDPQGEVLQPTVFETPTGETRVLCERPEHVGFYRLERDTTTVAEVAVNIDSRESDMTTHVPAGKNAAGTVVSTRGDFGANLREARQGREVFALFVFLAAMSLVAEVLLSRRA